jgi:hypothetical protein
MEGAATKSEKVELAEPKKEYQAVPLDKVPDPEAKKWRTVTYSFVDPIDGRIDVALRLLGKRDDVYIAALAHLFYDTCNEDPINRSVASLVDECRQNDSTEYMCALRHAVESIQIADNCPCCHR